MRKISFLLACLLVFGVFSSSLAIYADSDAETDGMAYYAELNSENCVIDENGTLVSYSGEYAYVMIIPGSIEDKQIKKINDGLFAGTPVSSVYIGEGVEEIGKSAFEGSELEYIDVPSTVKKVGENAFKGCEYLYSLSFSSDVELGKDALAENDFLYISALCSMDTDAFYDNIYAAKGDYDFWIDVMHTNLVESMFEKDVYGNSLTYCEDCGKEYRGCDDIELPFEDVPKGAWYYPYVVTAYEFDIMNGKSDTIFDPKGNITVAELVKIAACVHLCQQGDEGYEFAGDPETWYQPYLNYCYDKGLIEKNVVFNWEKDATRAEMAYLFSRADDGYYVPNDDVPLSDIPDVNENMAFALNILALYRRGIAVGSNEYYAFYPEAKLKRSEAAAIVSRILCYDMRTTLPKG